MKRFDDWASRLNAYVIAAQDRVTPGMAVDWGKDDCCTFIAGGVEAMTGVDPMAEFRGRYKTRLGAMKALKRIGGGSLETALTKVFGKPISPGFGDKGDVALLGDACGLVLGRKSIFLTDGGLTFIDTVKVDKVFRV